MNQTSVMIIIPNFNGQKLLAQYLPSVVRAAQPVGAKVIVADDASTDDSVAWLQTHAPEVLVLTAEKNRGFLLNCNRAVQEVPCDIVILLNNDMEVEEDFIAPLLKPFQNLDEVFAVSPSIRNRGRGDRDEAVNYFYFRHGLLQCSYPCLAEEYPPPPAGPIGYACGGAAAIDRKKFLELGGFDPLYAPGYWEDVDLSYRAWKRGWMVWHEPKSIVYHQHRATMGTLYSPSELDSMLTARQLWFNWKNLQDREMIIFHVLLVLPYHGYRYARDRRWSILKGLLTALARFPKCLRSRKQTQLKLSDREVIFRAKPCELTSFKAIAWY